MNCFRSSITSGLAVIIPWLDSLSAQASNATTDPRVNLQVSTLLAGPDKGSSYSLRRIR